jgi:hypothetical protein
LCSIGLTSETVTEETTSEVPKLRQDLDDLTRQLVNFQSVWHKSVLDEQSLQRLLNFEYRIQSLERFKMGMEHSMSEIISKQEEFQSRCIVLETTRLYTEEDITTPTKPRTSNKRRFDLEDLHDEQESKGKRALRKSQK